MMTTQAARDAVRQMPFMGRRRSDQPGDEGAALMFVILAMLMAASLSLLVLGTVLAQTRGTQFDRKNARAIHAAEAGTEVALSQIRAARKTDVYNKVWGDLSKLPCSVSGPVLDDGGMTYAVEVQYFRTDPNLQSQAWRNTNKISCSSSGTTVQPRFALILADGKGAGVPGLATTAGDRRLQSTYIFQITNENIAGGLIENYTDEHKTRSVCWEAASASNGAKVRLMLCDESKALQQWAWRTDYSIALVSTVASPTPLCATIPAGGGGTRTVTLTPCSNPPTNGQKFGFNDNAHFEVRPTGAGGTRFCPFMSTRNGVNIDLVADTGNCSGAQRSWNSWQPQAKVGAGSVGDSGDNVTDVANKRMQWVNFGEFGRCFDITNQDAAWQFMIAYPCKQDPHGTVAWNQLLTWNYGTASRPGTRQLVATQGSTNYCLTATDTPVVAYNKSPTRSGVGNAGSDRFVTMKACNDSDPKQRWTVNRQIPGDYGRSYTVVDTYGRCLSLRRAVGGAEELQWSSVVSATCDATGIQKWNAPPDPNKSTVRDQIEING